MVVATFAIHLAIGQYDLLMGENYCDLDAGGCLRYFTDSWFIYGIFVHGFIVFCCGGIPFSMMASHVDPDVNKVIENR